jgi:hypothetical protein
MNNRRKLIVALGAGPLALRAAFLMSFCLPARAADANMAEVRQLAREPVETIFAGAPIGRISAGDYWKTVRGSPKPVIVMFYANQDPRSRNLATLLRYLALEFANDIVFYGYPVTPGAAVERSELARLQKRYGVKQVPATFFYDNDHGKMELEKADYAVPALAEYRTPNMLLWNTYLRTIREYIQKHILD